MLFPGAIQSKIQIPLFCLLAITCSSLPAQQPNIIYIMSDDMGYGDLGCYGSKNIQTPHLDKLASQGIRFVNAYAAAPLCTPTRAAFMTGRYPAKIPVGLIEPLTGTPADTAYGLTQEHTSIATVLKAQGYNTALIGKWHLGSRARHAPLKNGFDYFYGIIGGAADYISHRGTGSDHDLFENDSLIYPNGYLTEMITDKAVGFLQQKHTSPFFLAVTFTAPHWPWQAPGDHPYPDTANFRNGGSATTYRAMIKSLDDGIGKIIQAMDELGLADKTIVIFTNDNGGERYSDNGGFSNSKGSLWEGGIRVPAFVRWPGKIKPGSVTQQVAITMDWTATILSAAGARLKDFSFDGIDLTPVLTGRRSEIGRTIYWRTFQRSKQQALRQNEWKYLRDEKGEHLFDLGRDPGETSDKKLEKPALFAQLKKQYHAWEKLSLPPKAL